MSPFGIAPRLILLFASLAVLSARAGATDNPETFKCSARGGPEWHEYRTKHFLLDTDLSRDSAAVLIKNLERLHVRVVQAMVGDQVEIPGRARVVAFSKAAQFHESVAAEVWGYFTTTGLKQPLIVIPGAGFEARPDVVAHELVHYVSYFLFPRQPRWFAEGLAEFIETLESPLADNEPAKTIGSNIIRGNQHLRGGVGVIPRDYGYTLQAIQPVPIKQLLNWSHLEAKAEPPYYVQSWLLYHWLWNNRGKEFADFQRRLTAAEEPSAAWRASFPEFDPLKPSALEELDKTLLKYRRSARYAFYRVEGEGDPAFTESKLAPAEVHLLLADLRLRGLNPEAREAMLRAELDEAIREDPTHPIAVARRARLDQSSPLASLRNSVVARPNDARAWYFLGRALSGSGDKTEAESAYRKALTLDPDSAPANNSLAALLEAKGQHKEALRFANKAVDLAPWDESCVDTLAAVAAGLGECSKAQTLQRQAVSLVEANNGSLAQLADEDPYTKRLHEYEARCTSTAAK